MCQLAIFVQPAPPGDPAGRWAVEPTGAARQTDRSDVVIEGNAAAELHQGDVIVEQCVVVVGMNDDLGDAAGNLIRVGPSLSLPSKVEGPWRQCPSVV